MISLSRERSQIFVRRRVPPAEHHSPPAPLNGRRTTIEVPEPTVLCADKRPPWAVAIQWAIVFYTKTKSLIFYAYDGETDL
jgi:hypothetical protein